MRDPDITGPRGKAWQAPETDEVRRRWPAGRGAWLLHCPGAHPFWSWYVVVGCSLADVPGLPPAHKHSPDMTHEIQIHALDPDHKPTDGWCTDGPDRWAKHRLAPPNLVEQTLGLTDEQFAELTRLLVRSFCDGLLSPDTDWRERQRNAIDVTADHLRAGRHLPS